jgi:hypothetical protein
MDEVFVGLHFASTECCIHFSVYRSLMRRIVFCRFIDNWCESPWVGSQLPHAIKQWSKERLVKLQGERTPELEGLIASLVYSLRSSSSPPAELCNLLAFIETLATHDSSAQVLVNSSLTPSLISLLGHEDSMLRTHAATALGILIRFASTIEVDLLYPGSTSQLPPSRIAFCQVLT